MTETHLTCVAVRTENKTLCRLIIKGNTTTIRMQDHAVHKVLHIKFVSLMTNVASHPDFISLYTRFHEKEVCGMFTHGDINYQGVNHLSVAILREEIS